jgi:hypothetical protein
MYVSVHSTTLGNDSKGKKSWGFVWDVKKNGEINRSHATDSIGSHPWAVILRGVSVHEYASGARGGTRVEVEAKVLVEMTPADICDLFNLVLSQGLVEVVPTAHETRDKNASAV